MTTEMRMSRLPYYFLIGLATQFVLGLVAFAILLPAGLLGQLPWRMIGFLLAYNVLIATLVAVMLTNTSEENKPAAVKGGGLLIGHLVGLLLGGFLGLRYGGILWAIGAAAALYFLLGWVGGRISLALGARLDRRAAPASPRDLQTALRLARPTTSSLFLFGAAVPAVLMGAAVLLRSSGLPLAQYPAILPAARAVLTILSLVSIAIPWLRRTQVRPRRGRSFSSGSPLWLIGLALSLAPAFFGFVLFVAFDMSLAELSLFAVSSSMAATLWGASRAGG